MASCPVTAAEIRLERYSFSNLIESDNFTFNSRTISSIFSKKETILFCSSSEGKGKSSSDNADVDNSKNVVPELSWIS